MSHTCPLDASSDQLLVPTKTTNTAAYAAVAESTSNGWSHSKKNDMIKPNPKTQRDVVSMDATRPGIRTMIIIGPTRNAPPNVAIPTRIISCRKSFAFFREVRVPPNLSTSFLSVGLGSLFPLFSSCPTSTKSCRSSPVNPSCRFSKFRMRSMRTSRAKCLSVETMKGSHLGSSSVLNSLIYCRSFTACTA